MRKAGTRKVTVDVKSVIHEPDKPRTESVKTFKMPNGWSVTRVETLLRDNGFTEE